jgi:hypothetical protein
MIVIDWKIDPSAPDMTNSSSDWDALQEGYLRPDKILLDSDQVQTLKIARSILESFFNACREAGIRNEC